MRSIINKFMSVSTAVALLTMTSGLPQALSTPGPTNIQLIPTFTSVALVNDELVATGTATATVNGQTTTVPITAPLDIAVAEPGVCPVLDLMLGPINLNLLGLVLHTSPICLTITAQPGGLLGDLLCRLGNLLNQGFTISEALATFTPSERETLLNGIRDVMNGALANLYQAVLTEITQVGPRHHTCAILHLEIGPLDLRLLGLHVVLDNCANGPVIVNIRAVTGPGNLLGNLLCGLLRDGLIDIGATLQQILDQIAGLAQ